MISQQLGNLEANNQDPCDECLWQPLCWHEDVPDYEQPCCIDDVEFGGRIMTSQQLGDLEEYINVNNQLIESYRNLVKILYRKIEGYRELYLRDHEELREEIKGLQSEIDASRKDDSHIKA